MVAGLPEPVRRWLTHAIAPGTPLRETAELSMRGEIRLGAWRPFRATQVLAPPRGFIWAATTRVAGLPVTGYDRYSRGTGEMRWRLLRAVPVMSATGADITRSAAGRLAGELPLVPAAALRPEVSWHPVDAARATASVRVGDEECRVTLTVSPSGAPESVTVPRWGNPDKAGYREHTFGGVFTDQAFFDGFTIPCGGRFGWWYGSSRWPKGEFFHMTIDHAAYH
ncbi:hypothetical protein GCM10009716_18410 [Streptomyces sodiiphilus]|uniref:Uncharacterized protein n=1 Tax=Streptomyces sodiiphilus TaxID=226217 RepID=A0ABP5AAX5_9ACTN